MDEGLIPRRLHNIVNPYGVQLYNPHYQSIKTACNPVFLCFPCRFNYSENICLSNKLKTDYNLTVLRLYCIYCHAIINNSHCYSISLHIGALYNCLSIFQYRQFGFHGSFILFRYLFGTCLYTASGSVNNQFCAFLPAVPSFQSKDGKNGIALHAVIN